MAARLPLQPSPYCLAVAACRHQPLASPVHVSCSASHSALATPHPCVQSWRCPGALRMRGRTRRSAWSSSRGRGPWPSARGATRACAARAGTSAPTASPASTCSTSRYRRVQRGAGQCVCVGWVGWGVGGQTTQRRKQPDAAAHPPARSGRALCSWPCPVPLLTPRACVWDRPLGSQPPAPPAMRTAVARP